MTTIEERVKEFHHITGTIRDELDKIIVGMGDVVPQALGAIMAGGHVLLEGMPGLGKTLLVKSFAKSLGLSFKRIQFTPDLMPSDITGTEVLNEQESGKRSFEFKQGPIFANVVLADEVNRATPKTQSALLEAMEERQITVLSQTHKLPAPFFVLATQNPVELEGTYPLPEAQLDRFMVKLVVGSPSGAELKEILIRTTGGVTPEVKAVIAPEEAAKKILDMRALVRDVVIAPQVLDTLVRMVGALSPGQLLATDRTKKYVRVGPGPRGAQSVVLAAKVSALYQGRINVSVEDVKESLLTALRHRMILTYQADADGVTADSLITEVKNAK
jgi:MoxR-like ATPase